MQQISASEAATRARGCSGAARDLSSCLTYVAEGSSLTRLEKGCCGALAGAAAGAPCLCGLIVFYGERTVDTVRALALPTVCRVDEPAASLCAEALAVGVGRLVPPLGGTAPAEPEFRHPAGSGRPATTPATATGNGSRPAMHRSPEHEHLIALLFCLMLFARLL